MGDFNHPHPLPLARERGATYSLYLLLCHWRLVHQCTRPDSFLTPRLPPAFYTPPMTHGCLLLLPAHSRLSESR